LYAVNPEIKIRKPLIVIPFYETSDINVLILLCDIQVARALKRCLDFKFVTVTVILIDEPFLEISADLDLDNQSNSNSQSLGKFVTKYI